LKKFCTILAVIALVTLSGVVFANSASAVSVVCNSHVDYPHNSTHVPGTVNVVGSTSCTLSGAPGIWQSIQLYRDGVSVAYGYNYQTSGGTYAEVTAATTCAPGQYYGRMRVDIPGYTPPSGYAQSSTVQIDC
jgi:hypothetical protein